MTVRFAVPLRATVGTRPVSEPDWLVLDEARDRQLKEKRRLLAERPEDVTVALPGTEPGCAEAGDLLLDWYRRRRPDTRVAAADSAWAAASLTAAEDLCLMQRIDGEWRLTAGVVCFPSRWRLGDKIGVGLAAIHDPVPGFAGPVARASEQVFDRLEPDRILLRFNWSLLDDATLFQPTEPEPGAQPRIQDPGTDLFLRVERQTLRALPRSGDVLFTIHTRVDPLGEVAADGSRARELAASLRSAPPETLAYKGWLTTAALAADWLEDHAGEVVEPASPTTA